MTLASALESERCHVDAPWWLTAPSLASEPDNSASQATAWYQFGDAVLEISVDDPLLLVSFEQLYGECAASAPVVSEARVRCVIRGTARTPLLLITFLEGSPPDPAVAALGLLHPLHGDPPYAVRDAPLMGWRLVGDTTRPVVAASATRVLIDTQRVAEDFLVEYLVSATLESQPDLLVVHAAALQIDTAGVLLAGRSRAGKTTTSAHLAARGHALLGDEMALIRLPTSEIVPLRRCLSLRSGPRSPELAAMLRQLGVEETSVNDGKTRPLRIDAMFPGSRTRPVPLRAVFFLSGFADQPSLEPVRPTLYDLDVFDALAANDIALVSWGLTQARRAFRLMALKHILVRSRCWRLKVGPPVETAELIERTMGEQ